MAIFFKKTIQSESFFLQIVELHYSEGSLYLKFF